MGYSVSLEKQTGEGFYSPQGNTMSKYQKLVFEKVGKKRRGCFIVYVFSRRWLVVMVG